MDMVMRDSARARAETVDEAAAAERTAAFKAQVEQQSDAFYISSMCLDDGVIDPRDTRNVIGCCLVRDRCDCC
jgi:acetyl-CoA carboxylase carboxyltransferase component